MHPRSVSLTMRPRAPRLDAPSIIFLRHNRSHALPTLTSSESVVSAGYLAPLPPLVPGGTGGGVVGVLSAGCTGLTGTVGALLDSPEGPAGGAGACSLGLAPDESGFFGSAGDWA